MQDALSARGHRQRKRPRVQAESGSSLGGAPRPAPVGPAVPSGVWAGLGRGPWCLAWGQAAGAGPTPGAHWLALWVFRPPAAGLELRTALALGDRPVLSSVPVSTRPRCSSPALALLGSAAASHACSSSCLWAPAGHTGRHCPGPGQVQQGLPRATPSAERLFGQHLVAHRTRTRAGPPCLLPILPARAGGAAASLVQKALHAGASSGQELCAASCPHACTAGSPGRKVARRR